MAVSAPQPLKWTREAFQALCESGLLKDQYVELFEGEIIEMPPPSPRHVLLVRALALLAERLAPKGTYVRREEPLSVEECELVPDVAVVVGSFWDYADHHPSTALFAAEVETDADRYTLKKKADAYARAGIPEYLVIDIERSRVIQFKQPSPQGYEWRQEYRAAEILPLLGEDTNAAGLLSPKPDERS